MREKQLPVNENVFNALIMGHSNADDLESAAGILGVMSQAGLEPSADSYTTLICGFARKGDIDSINKFIEQCEAKEVYLLDKDYLEVVYALAVNGHDGKIDEVLSRLKKAFGYNQDAVNVILRLINRGQEPTALKVLKTMPRVTRNSGEQSDAGNFLIKQLIKANRPVEQVLNICQELDDSGMNSKPILIAVEAALNYGNSKLSQALLIELNAKGLEVRQHFFWPVFCAAQNEQEAFEIAELMQKNFNLNPSNQTVREYIVPKLLINDDYDSVIQKLRKIGISLASSASATAYVALTKNNIEKSAEILNSYDCYLSPGLFKKTLVLALAQTKDYDSYVMILRRINDNIHRSRNLNRAQKHEVEEEEEVEETEVVDDVPVTSERSLKALQADVIGDFVIDAAFHFKTNRVEVLENILQRLVDQGLSISSSKAERIQDRLGESLTAEISTLLGKLTSGELEPIAFEKTKAPRTPGSNQMDTDGIERIIARLEAKGENTKGMKRQLLVSAIRARDIVKTEEIVERLKAEGYILTSGVYAQLIELYSSADKLEEALSAFKKIRETDPDFKLDEVKTVKVAQAFVNADRFDEAIKFLVENKPVEMPDEKAFNYQTTCWRLLNSLAEKGKTVEVNRIYDALVANSFVIPNNVILGPLIKVHLVQNELKAAVDKFEEICQKHRSTPWKNEIACRLIQAEDATNLQRVTDLSTEIHGEVNSLYDLVFSFIECGRVRQARKILETPGLRTRQGRINSACERYLNENMFTALEGLVEATKDLNHIDRAEIYYSLLQTYIKEVSPEKALGLWTAMQEEEITPSDAFLAKLAAFLKAEGHEVPFHVPDAPEPVKAMKTEKPIQVKTGKSGSADKEPMAQRKKEPEQSPNVSAFKIALKAGNVDEILGSMKNLQPVDKLSLTDRSLVIEALLRNDQLPTATAHVFELMGEKLHPIPRIFRYYLNKLAVSGDTETLDKIGSQLDSETKKLVSFDNRRCHSFVAGGKSDEYLQSLEDAIDNATTPEEIAKAGEEFPRGGAIGIIDSNPECAQKFEKVAAKYAAKKILGPMNVLWMQLYINHDPKADAIFKEHLVDAPRLMFQRVIQMGREKQDAELVQKLITLLHDSKVSEGAIGNAYSCLLDIHAAKNDADACLTSVEACVKDVCFENVNKTALLRAKECVEKAGKKFPHTIPDRKTTNQNDSSSSSSSSSSDDEVTRKKKS